MSAEDPRSIENGSSPSGVPTITPYEGGPVPAGHVVVRDQDGNTMLLDVAAAKAASDRLPPTELTPDQIRRIAAFKHVLVEHETTSLDEALTNFRRDRTPEREIQVWEQIARTYGDELADRPVADATERRLLYKTIFACSFYGTKEEVLEAVPDASSLPDLGRVIERWSR